jgi:hypothetical protein
MKTPRLSGGNTAMWITAMWITAMWIVGALFVSGMIYLLWFSTVDGYYGPQTAIKAKQAEAKPTSI